MGTLHRRRAATALIPLVAAAASACGGPPAGGPPGGGFPPAEVAVVTVEPTALPVSYEFSAAVIPYRRIEVRPRVEGLITQRAFTEGEVVAVGDLLYRIEPARYEAAFHAAESRVQSAQLRVDRYAPLLAQNAVARQDVDNAKSDLEAAQAALAQAKRDFDDTYVRAELAGRVGRTLLDVGARVSGPNDLLTTIDRLDPVYVSFRPSSQQVLDWSRDPAARALITPGSRMMVEAVLPDGSVAPQQGKLDFVAPALDYATGTQEFRATFANANHLLVPGQFVRARLRGFRVENALAVPVRAVQTGMGRQFVYVATAGDTARARDVVTGQWSGDQWIITKGLAAGDRVIVDGIQKVGPGRPVHAAPLGAASDVPAGARGVDMKKAPSTGKAP